MWGSGGSGKPGAYRGLGCRVVGGRREGKEEDEGEVGGGVVESGTYMGLSVVRI